MSRLARLAAAVVLLLFAGAGIAGAHAVLVSTDPADGVALATGPDRVTATFNEKLQPTFAAMTVVGPDRHLWSTGEAEVSGPNVSIAVGPLGPAGTYTANYRVTSADGHVVSGSWKFELTAAGDGQPGPAVDAPRGHDARGHGQTSGGEDLPIWPFVAGTLVIVGVGLWFARPRSGKGPKR